MNFTKLSDTTIYNNYPINNLTCVVYARYNKDKNLAISKEWYTISPKIIINSNLKIFSELILFFEHIDDDNPEFFLQPGQKINIITGNLFINKNLSKEKGILLINKFIHVSE
ncbi:MAG: hypothetical protein Q8889_01485 [Candidatus Phytoplasma australasiaticum]|nr:hypothetical protein [Candidatus Phytoplasma australasiaticum]MDV3199782.1 hypothetical protein [Candidatus Phytoplasma australasiaticum]